MRDGLTPPGVPDKIDWAKLKPPPEVPVVAGSLPVAYFGDPETARVATIGLNPSSVEFLDAEGRLLVGSARRLATVESVGAGGPGLLTSMQAQLMLADCATYFSRNPYRGWFDQLDQLIRRAFGASYFDGSACHLDLSVWATDPAWGSLGARLRQTLLAEGVPILRSQLERLEFDVVLLNGRAVLEQVQAAGLVGLRQAERLTVGAVTSELFLGAANGARWIGWSTNLQSSFGVTNQFREQLAARVGKLTDTDVAQAIRQMTPTPRADGPGFDEFLPAQTLHSKRDLFDLLELWLQRSRAPTIADVDTYGGRAWLWIELGAHSVHVNADTTRKAVLSYVQRHRSNPTGPWPVVRSRDGKLNKVLQGPDSTVVAGWYAYVKTPLHREGCI